MRFQVGGYRTSVHLCEADDLIVWVHDGSPRTGDIEAAFRRIADQPFFHPEVACLDVWADGFDPSQLDGAAILSIAGMSNDILGRRLAARPPRYAVLDYTFTSRVFGRFYTLFMRDVAGSNLPVAVSQNVTEAARLMGEEPTLTASRVSQALTRHHGRPHTCLPVSPEALLAG